MNHTNNNTYLNMKRVIDIILSLVGIVLVLPLFLIISVVIKLDSKGPVIFKQKRFGKNKRIFYLIKFRTMRIDSPKDTPTHLLINPEKYITKVGKILRISSVDEIPQLWNIFIGELSIIGPRPALWNQYDLIAERDKYEVNSLIPGLTGLAQISGRDELEIQVKAKLDGEYLKQIGFLFDCRCFIGTILSVLKHDGIVEGRAVGYKKPRKKL